MKNSGRALTTLSALIIIIATLPLLLTGCPRQPAERLPTTTTTRVDERPALPQEINGLDQPVAMAFSPDGRIFITERVGRIRIFEEGHLREQPFATVDVPRLRGYHETGLLGIALHPDFETQPYIYVYHTHTRDGRLFNRVVRFRDDSGGSPSPEIIIDNIPAGRIHNGGIIVFGPDENLYISTGDSGQSNLAQNIDSTAGKILRVEPNGDIPADNPFPNSPVYSYGHRNVFGMAFHPETGVLYITENGPDRDDEINRIEAGGNFGWPIVTGRAGDERFIDPLTTYTPNIAPTQAIFYTGDLINNIRGRFIFGAYNTGNLRALELAGPGNGRVERDEVVFDANRPIIGVAQSPDGAIYIANTDSIRRIERLED
ncbi:MAG: PQQ-dependent sugar dehydrogenase [Actinobacteria bacterium]|nr:PQQ-dependent sugar dehydrogenase [Actinomycetota bacterium]